jgi:hypothetical protein
LLDFGRGTPVVLHGRERVSTAAEVAGETGVRAEIVGLRTDLARYIEGARRAMRDDVAIARGRAF